MAPQIFWLGLGNMGRGMVTNLAQKGKLEKPLLIYNRTQKRADDLAAKIGGGKVEVVSDPLQGLKRSDIVFTMLSNDKAVEENFDAFLSSGDVKGKLFIDCSTIHPDTTERLAKKVTDAGGEFIASPVFGAPPAADAGALIFVPSGPKAVVDKLKPYTIGVMGKAEVSLADRPYGAASTLKLIGNTFVLNMVTQLAEAFTVAEKSGVGVEPVKDFVDTLFGGVYSGYAERMTKGTYWKLEEPLFSADNAIKDATHAQSIAKAAGVEVKNAGNAREYLEDVKKQKGGEKGDIAGIYGAARVRAGLNSNSRKLPASFARQLLLQSSNVAFFKLQSPNVARYFTNKMAGGGSIFLGLVIVAALSVGAWFFAPKGENQTTWRSSLIIAFVACYLMWFVTFMAQLNPLIAPKNPTVREGYQHE
ncbi:putative NAD binding domain of 6-phosphogluconate dehydrogenase-domain-containing protein [Seiridium unicorne]|uniref:NAD binding domain of 6-phosphogluconate dehydrogenase-domain-containing protein n=1 Tax=Seiridium unicorne TaxID=138068 RepID=A0ABR2V7K5_9PEZI